jgi:hypothetical protein
MEQRSFVELLAVCSEQLDPRTIDRIEAPELSPQECQELGTLLRLAGRVKEALAPVHPSPSFKGKLRADLAEMARYRKSRNVVLEVPSRPRELLIGAAIGSAVALAGGIAYLIRVRSQARS